MNELKSMNNSKLWYNSKTIWFNIVMFIIAVLTLAQGSFSSHATILAFFASMGNIALRIFFTNTAISSDAPVA